jgi:DNA-binding response OmpR family regulator
MSHRILLVEADKSPAAAAEEALVCAGHRVVWLESFNEAVRLRSALRHDLMVAALRLGPFNGLHLLLRLRATDPELPAVIMGEPSDLTADVARFRATFVTKPIDDDDLRRAVADLLVGRPPRDPDCGRAWPRKRSELAATVRQISARVVELSYGGLRMRTSRPVSLSEASSIDIMLPTLGLTMPVRPRWTTIADDGGTCFGAEVAPDPVDAMRHWRWVVDSLGGLN